MTTYVKRNPGRAGKWEAAGLRWLSDASEGVAVVDVLDQDEETLTLERVDEGAPSPQVAEDFGRHLFHTHAAGAKAFGVGPPGWHGDGYQGPNDDLRALPLGAWEQWGEFYSEAIVEPLVRQAKGQFAAQDLRDIEALCERLRAGDFDTCDKAARIHGDLWAGNVLWRADPAEAVLIDSAAHGGHPETDLAALALFGAPHVDRVFAAYEEIAGWDRSWRERVPVHKLHLLLLHVAVFGGGYVGQAMTAVRRGLAL